MNNRKRDFSKEEGLARENDEKRVKGNSLSPNHVNQRQPLRDVTNILPNNENEREGNTQKCISSILESNEILDLSNIDSPSTSADQIYCQIRSSLDDLSKDEKLANIEENKKETKEEEDKSDAEEEAIGTQQARQVRLLLPEISEYDEEYVRCDKLAEIRQAIPADFMKEQEVFKESDRKIVVEWLKGVSQHSNLASDTLAFGVKIMDSFFSIRKNLTRSFFQLVGAVSLRLAAKIEGDDGSLGVDVVVYLCANGYTENMVHNMEKLIFFTLKHHLFVTPFNFARFFVRNAKEGDISLKLTSYLCELSLMESTYHQFFPSLIAAAALYCARQILRREIHWDVDGFHSGYTVEQIAPCARLLHRLYEERQNPQNGYSRMFVHYNTIDNHQVSSLAPFSF